MPGWPNVCRLMAHRVPGPGPGLPLLLTPHSWRQEAEALCLPGGFWDPPCSIQLWSFPSHSVVMGPTTWRPFQGPRFPERQCSLPALSVQWPFLSQPFYQSRTQPGTAPSTHQGPTSNRMSSDRPVLRAQATMVPPSQMGNRPPHPTVCSPHLAGVMVRWPPLLRP